MTDASLSSISIFSMSRSSGIERSGTAPVSESGIEFMSLCRTSNRLFSLRQRAAALSLVNRAGSPASLESNSDRLLELASTLWLDFLTFDFLIIFFPLIGLEEHLIKDKPASVLTLKYLEFSGSSSR